MGTFAAIGEWFVSTKAGRAVLASVFALLAMAIGTSVGWIEGERFGTRASGKSCSACIVRGQRAAFSATTSPFFHR